MKKSDSNGAMRVCGHIAIETVNVGQLLLWTFDGKLMKEQSILNLIFRMNADCDFKADFNDLIVFSILFVFFFHVRMLRSIHISTGCSHYLRLCADISSSANQTSKQTNGKNGTLKQYETNSKQNKLRSMCILYMDCVRRVLCAMQVLTEPSTDTSSVTQRQHKVDSNTFLKTISFSFAYHPSA